MHGALAHSLVDPGDELLVLGFGSSRVARANRLLETPELGLDSTSEVPVLEALALGARDPLFLGGDVGHRERQV